MVVFALLIFYGVVCLDLDLLVVYRDYHITDRRDFMLNEIFTKTIEVLGLYKYFNIFPNTYDTVMEMARGSFGNIVNNMGGLFLFWLAVGSLVVLLWRET